MYCAVARDKTLDHFSFLFVLMFNKDYPSHG